jgi:hypothetical protein
MRGQRYLSEIVRPAVTRQIARKGRDNSLIEKRNRCLLARYYYYVRYKDKCFEDVLRLLVAEFYLSPTTLSKLLLDNSEKLQEMKAKDPALYYFQSNWPHIKW